MRGVPASAKATAANVSPLRPRLHLPLLGSPAAASRQAAKPAPHCRYAAAACPVRFELLNAYTPGARWLGAFDRVHVGASVPPDRLAPLLALLKPEVGRSAPDGSAAS